MFKLLRTAPACRLWLVNLAQIPKCQWWSRGAELWTQMTLIVAMRNVLKCTHRAGINDSITPVCPPNMLLARLTTILWKSETSCELSSPWHLSRSACSKRLWSAHIHPIGIKPWSRRASPRRTQRSKSKWILWIETGMLSQNRAHWFANKNSKLLALVNACSRLPTVSITYSHLGSYKVAVITIPWTCLVKRDSLPRFQIRCLISKRLRIITIRHRIWIITWKKTVASAYSSNSTSGVWAKLSTPFWAARARTSRLTIAPHTRGKPSKQMNRERATIMVNWLSDSRLITLSPLSSSKGTNSRRR